MPEAQLIPGNFYRLKYGYNLFKQNGPEEREAVFGSVEKGEVIYVVRKAEPRLNPSFLIICKDMIGEIRLGEVAHYEDFTLVTEEEPSLDV